MGSTSVRSRAKSLTSRPLSADEQMTATTTVEATVIRLLTEFELVELETDAGDSLMVGRQTRGVAWQDLRHGQRLKCQVEGDVTPRVTAAETLT